MSGGPGDPGAGALDIRPAGRPARADGSLLDRPLAHWRERASEELALPAGLLVAAGHQPEWWHPGIVAKFLWARATAATAGASVAWLLVDTDLRDPCELRFPARAGGDLRASVHRFAPRMAPGCAPAGRPACTPSPPDAAAGEPALPCVADGLRRAHDAMLRHVDAADRAGQVAGALAAAVPGLEAPHATARTSGLLATSLGRALLDRAAADPAACARAFNGAVRLVPRVARPLAEGGPAGAELPFWTVAPDGARQRVTAGALADLRGRGAPLWPRAFLTSLLARAALCDRFVHGTGAATYERATEAFALAWLGAALPPIDVASATLLLPFPPEPGPPPVDAAARRRRWFDPSAAGPGPSAAKRAALAEIAGLPRGSPSRRDRWRRMHAELAAERTARASDLAELEALAAADRVRARSAAVRADRTWPAVLHPPEAISRLSSLVASRAR